MKFSSFTISLQLHYVISSQFFILLSITPYLANAQFGPQYIITGCEACGATSVYSADLDGDGDMDVLAASHDDGKIAWYENTGGGDFGPQHILSTEADGAQSVYAADLDGDGDLDVLSASFYFYGRNIAWYQNMGSGFFGSQRVISNIPHAFSSVYAADLDGDGDLDVLAAIGGGADDQVAWYENMGGGLFGTQNIISSDSGGGGTESVYATDLDGDGDIDILTSGILGDIAWLENLGGGVFGPLYIISEDHGALSAYASDLDGDGDMDVLSAFEDDDKIAWYENTGGGAFGPQLIISTEVNSAQSVFASDLDGDGDMDVLSASAYDNKIAWYENKSITTVIESEGVVDYLQIYPNPSTGIVNLVFRHTVMGNYSVRLVDVFGRTAYRSTFRVRSGENVSLDCSQLIDGTYFLTVYSDKQGAEYTGRIVIQR